MESAKKRGRPSLGKAKTPATPSSKGRGRPKKILEPGSATKDSKTPIKEVAKKPRGRPSKTPADKKVVSAGETKRHVGRIPKKKPVYVPTGRPLGRPPSGKPVVKLNIIATGRRRGRPKAKRGPYVPTGRPRGRPKANALVVEEAEEEPVTPKKRGRLSLTDNNIQTPSPSKLVRLF